MKNIIVIMALFIGFSISASAKVYDYTEGNRLTLLEDPASAVDYKIELIKKARHHVHILTFFWDETNVPKRFAQALNEANARGVEVRILGTFIPTFGTDLIGKGRRQLNTKSTTAVFSYLNLTPGSQFSLTHNLHEKVLIVDGEKAIIGGRNVSDSSLAGKDIEVQIEGGAVNQVQHHFKVMYDFVSAQKEKEQSRFSELDQNFFPIQPVFENGSKARILSHEAILHQAAKKMSRAERLLQPDDILDTVTKIEFKKLRAYNYFLIPTERYQQFLEKNLAEGNSIEIITNSIESGKFSSNSGYIYALPNMLNLVNKGLKLYGWERKQKYNYVHEKVLIFDEDHVVIGSHNFGTGSTSVSNELSIEFFSKPIADRLSEVFSNEISDRRMTRVEDAELLEKEISENKGLIRILHNKKAESLLKEIY